MILTIDIGNSRIKYACWQAEAIVSRGALAYGPDKLAEVFGQLFSGLEKPLQVLVVSVAAQQVSRQLKQWVADNWQLPVAFLEARKKYKDITHAYADPAQHGADRWAAVVAGHQMFPHATVCVISAGTAITFDFINKDGMHLGGYILPSYVTMHAALLGDTANVASALKLQFEAADEGMPDNTDDAVNRGLHRLLQAGIREISRSAQAEKIIITGGFAQTVLDYPDVPEMLHQPDLVMQGLYSIMSKAESRVEG